jgi:hypothetical protein
VTGTSETMARHNRQYAGTVAGLAGLAPSDLVIEIGSNDGSLLKCFRGHGARTLGIEPAANIAEIARGDGIETISPFFDSSVARKVRDAYGPARIVTANNVLAHVDETQDFLLGCKTLLSDEGLVVVEVPYLRELLDHLEYDTIYHEHLCYFSVNTLLKLCDAVGLSAVRVDQVPVHGGSLRLFAGLPDRYGDHAQAVVAQAEAERVDGLTGYARYEQFAQAVKQNRREITDLLCRLVRDNKTVAGYGAPAKGNTLLNFCQIDTSLLPYTVDKSPLKVGLYTPGMHIPVLPVSTLLERQPDYVLILAWNFAEEIMDQQKEYRDRGGRFILPIPEPRLV